MKKVVLFTAAAVAVLLLVVQIVPYGRDHSNPPVTAEPRWKGEQTRALTVRACFDCHSNEVRWPWYSNVAPMSWLIQNHVDEAREELNYSQWDRPYDEAEESAETVQDGEMPPLDYLLLHPSAKLSDAERLELIRGLQATFGGETGGGEDGHDSDDDDD